MMRISEFIQQFLAEAGISAPDGRLLHAYHLSDATFSDLQRTLSELKSEQFRNLPTSALYVLWASERIRRSYDGSGLSWEFIDAPLLHEFEGQKTYPAIRKGLDFWQRPLRRGKGGHRMFMYSLLAEGGIPQKVLEQASKQAQILRQMIEEIGSRGGLDILGEETAKDIARRRMRYLPNLLQNDDTISLFVELAQAIFELRQAIPPGIDGNEIDAWLNRERPEWQRELPLRVTPQVIDNIIRPSLAAPHRTTKVTAWPVSREIHLDSTVGALPVAVLAPSTVLPLKALPSTTASELRLLPRFEHRRSVAYQALRHKDDETEHWELRLIGARGSETVPLGLFDALEFDVMAGRQTLPSWTALVALPKPDEVVSLWADPGHGDRLHILAGGRSRAASVWALAPEAAEVNLEPDLELIETRFVGDARLLKLHGRGTLNIAPHRLRIETGAEGEAEPAALFPSGKVLAQWRLASGEAAFLGEPFVFAQRGEHELHRPPASQLHCRALNSGGYGVTLCDWNIAGERIAFLRYVSLPPNVVLSLNERAGGGLDLTGGGLPPDMLLDLRAANGHAHLRTDGTAFSLRLPPCQTETAWVSLSLTELSTGRRLQMRSPWPFAAPRIVQDEALSSPRDYTLAFDELRSLTVFAPGNNTRMTVELVQDKRSFDLAVSGTVPLIRHEALLRKALSHGSPDGTVRLSFHNAAGETGRVELRRYYANMLLDGDLLKLGLPVDLPKFELREREQVPGVAELYLLRLDTCEVAQITQDVFDTPLDLRAATGIENGLWLVYGRFGGHTQRPVAWQAAAPDPNQPAVPLRRDLRIKNYCRELEAKARDPATDNYWKKLLQLILAARDGGDPAMLDQFMALAQTSAALARMLFALSDENLHQFFGLDSYWNVLWSGFPIADLAEMAKSHRKSLQATMIMAQIAPATAAKIAKTALIDRLALLRQIRPDMAGVIAVTLIETDLLAHIASDARFQGMLVHNPQATLSAAIQEIARNDPALLRGVTALRPHVLSSDYGGFQKTVEIIVGAALALAEQAVGLGPMLNHHALLDVMLIEAAEPSLFAGALQPAIMFAYLKKQDRK